MNLLGCPVANNAPSCPRCGGGWPGTLMTDEKLLGALRRGTLHVDKIPCGVIRERLLAWQRAHGEEQTHGVR